VNPLRTTREDVVHRAKPVATGSLFRFLQMSGFSFLLNLGLTILLHQVFHFSAELAYAIALLSVLVTNFVVMRWYVFSGSGQPLARQAVGFLAASTFFRGMEYLAFLLLHSVLTLNYVVAIVLVMGLAFVVKFFFYRQHIFAASPSVDSK